MLPQDIRRYKESSFPLLSAFIGKGQTGPSTRGSGFPSISGNDGDGGTRLPQISNRVSLVAMSQAERNVGVIRERDVAKYAMDTRRERAPDRNNRNRGKRSRGTVDSDLRHKPDPVGGQNSKPLHKQRNRKRHVQKTETDFANNDDEFELRATSDLTTSVEKIKEAYDSKRTDQKGRDKSHDLKESNDSKRKANQEERSKKGYCDRSTTNEITSVAGAKDDLRRQPKEEYGEITKDKDERNTKKLSVENKNSQEEKKPSSGKRWKPIMVRRKKDTPALWSENAPADSWEEECKKANDLVRMNEAIKDAVKPAKKSERMKDVDGEVIEDETVQDIVKAERSPEAVNEKNKATVNVEPAKKLGRQSDADTEIIKYETQQETMKNEERVEAFKEKNYAANVKKVGHSKKVEVKKNSKDDANTSSGHRNKSKAARSTNRRKTATKEEKVSDDGTHAKIICHDKIKDQCSYKPNVEKRQMNKRKESEKRVTKAAKENESSTIKDVQEKYETNKMKRKEHNKAEKSNICDVVKRDGPKPHHANRQNTSHKRPKQSMNIKTSKISNAQESNDKSQTGKENKGKSQTYPFKRVKRTHETQNKEKKNMDKIKQSEKTTPTVMKPGVSISDGRVSKQKPKGPVTVPAASNTSMNKSSSQNPGRVSRKAHEPRLVKSRTQSAAQDVRQSIKVQPPTSVSKYTPKSVSVIGDGRATATSSTNRSVRPKSSTTEHKKAVSRTSNTSAKTSLSHWSKGSKRSAPVGQLKQDSSKPSSTVSSKSLSRIPIPSRSPSVRSATPSAMRQTSGKSMVSASSIRSSTKSVRKMTPGAVSVAKSSTSKYSAVSTQRSTKLLSSTESRSSTGCKSAIPVPIRPTSKASVISANQKRFACSSRPVSASTVSTMSPVNRSISSRASSIRTCISRASTRATSSALSSYSEEFEYESVASSTPESLRKSWKK